MALEEIELDLSTDELPTEIRGIVDESDLRIDALFADRGNLRVPKYMPSDPELFYRALAFITEQDLPLGRVFCEWGCGFGICACIAAKLGYEAYGVELDPKMAAEARSLADDLGIPVEILETSYVPGGYDSYTGVGGECLIKEDRMASRDDRFVSELIYDGMDREIAEIDVFFVYPWPLEQDFMQELFDEIAVEGAILIAFHKSGEILAYRKIGEDDDEEG